MKQKQLLIGLGLGLLAYYLYTRSKNKAAVPSEEKKEGSSTLPSSGGVVAPTPMANNNRVVDEGKSPNRIDRFGRPIRDIKINPEEKELTETLFTKYGLKGIPQKGDIVKTLYGTYRFDGSSVNKMGNFSPKGWEKITSNAVNSRVEHV